MTEIITILALLTAVIAAVIGIGIAIFAVFWKRKPNSTEDAVLREQMRQLQADKDELKAENQALEQKYDGEREIRIQTEEKLRQRETHIADWQKLQEDTIQSGKAMVLQSLADMSTKLLKDHKSESEDARKHIGEVNKNLQKHFDSLVQQVSQFQGQVTQQESSLAALKRILTEPTKMGNTAEVILENNLKALGLSEHQDFLLQHSFDTVSGKLRPDAVIFLPDDYVIVVDSKTSGILAELALAEQENGEETKEETKEEAGLNQKLKTAMHKHLRDLGGKEYLSAVERGIKSSQRSFRPKQIITLMWLPSDGVLERIRRADSQFIYNASEKGIIVVGPSALQSAMTIAAVKISTQKQNENQARIVQETESLLQYITVALGYATSVGKAIHTANRAFDKLSNSVNKRLLPKARRIVELGVNKPQGEFGKPLPSQSEDIPTIEADEETPPDGDEKMPEEIPPEVN